MNSRILLGAIEAMGSLLELIEVSGSFRLYVAKPAVCTKGYTHVKKVLLGAVVPSVK